MRLHLGLLIKDLAFIFQISTTRVSQIWITWVKLLSKEPWHLIIWPSKGQIYATLPDVFKRFYSKVRVISDCSGPTGPYDTVVADRGFKIKSDLTMK